MTSTIPEAVILKTDARGRVKTPLAQREALVDAFERSGLSGMKFAALHGVKYPSFANWVQQRKRRRLMASAGGEWPQSPSPEDAAQGSGARLQWWEAVVDEPTAMPNPNPNAIGPSCRGLQLHLSGGVRMEITAAAQVAWAAQLFRAMTADAAPRASHLQPAQSC